MRKLFIVLVGVSLMGGLPACQKTVDPVGSDTDTFTQNVKDIQTYATSKGLSGTALNSGLYYVLTKANPTGKLATYGEELEFSYKLFLLTRNADGSVTDKLLDTTYATKSTYLPFSTGFLQPGLEEGILRMHEGEQATLLLPAKLAFGNAASTDGNIPANSMIRWDVTLKRSRTEAQQIDEYLTANPIGAVDRTSSGLRFILTKANPTGAVPATGQTYSINYSGRLLRSATPFDKGTLDWSPGQNKYVKGFEEALSRMRVGEKATVFFPSTLGYGTTGIVQNGTYVIPPNAPLSFDLEIVAPK